VTRLALAAGTAALLAAPAASAQDADRSVQGGGISVAGWQGKIDRRAASQGKTIKDSKFATEGQGLRLTIGPAASYWNPANTASGDYEVMATFTELKGNPKHPHPAGLFIGGRDLSGDAEQLMYCIVYGTGKYSIKTFHGEKVSTLVNMEASPAIKTYDANGKAANMVGWRVQGGNASCVINGTVVKTLSKAEYAGADKIASTDGVYGIRVSHNVDLMVTGLMKH
jgi:opacity protein-like surface antigen